MNAMTLTPADLESGVFDSMPRDMQDDARKALSSGEETTIEYNKESMDQESIDYIYFPNAGRGGVCTNGPTDWTNCDGLDDLANRWMNYEEMWIP